MLNLVVREVTTSLQRTYFGKIFGCFSQAIQKQRTLPAEVRALNLACAACRAEAVEENQVTVLCLAHGYPRPRVFEEIQR